MHSASRTASDVAATGFGGVARLRPGTGQDRKGPLTLCDRSFLEYLNELISGARLKEQRLFHGITGIVPHPDDDEKENR